MQKLYNLDKRSKEKVHIEALNVLKNESEKCFIGDEMLILNKNMHFFDDKKFLKILEDTATSDFYKGMAWRLHTLVWASKQALKISGDFIECGVFRGFKSFFLINYFENEMKGRNYLLCDTYEGIDKSQSHLSPINQSEHNKTRLYDFIKFRFQNFDNVKIIKGSVPFSLKNLTIEHIAFLHLDMNSYQAEIGALNYLWDKISYGGIIILDDFGLYSHKAQMENELPWFEKRGYSILELPTGQGIIIK